jgi:outer membrane protein OmpA-like peptidoglycan-associated protein
MSKKALYLLGIFIAIIIGSVLNYLINCNDYSTLTKKNSFKISDNKSGFNLDIKNNFNFLTSNASFLKPLSGDVLDGISKLKEQLLKNPSQIVNISGFFKSDEKNNSEFENLGLARANSIKDYLVSLGISANQLSTSSALNDAITNDENNTLFGPLAFSFIGKNSANKTLSDADRLKYEKLKGTSFVFNFNTGKSSTSLSKSEKAKMVTISKAIKALGLKVSIVGHTDSVGSNGFNEVLGQKRANFVKEQLLINGSSDSDIVTSSQGENNPVASNNTSSGRSKNRRTVITIN